MIYDDDNILNDGARRRRVAVLGSTGSIGTQTLDIIAEYSGMFDAVLLSAHRQWELLASQALRFGVRKVVITDEAHYGSLRDALAGSGIEVAAGMAALEQEMEAPDIDIVVGGIVGYSGLASTLRAARSGKTIALANKETLVAAGALVTAEARRGGAALIPVDSEHSAIYQCLVGEERGSVEKLILTASGGPFRTFTAEQLEHVGVADALRHPNWRMGAKVTIDSASMMNKGLEMIEAHWLFDCEPERIEVAVHPQSIVHSMVQFADGSLKAQLGLPDMHIPIRYALGYPRRLPSKTPALQLHQYRELTFEEPDAARFPLLPMAYEAIAQGGTMPCTLNAANEVAVDAFLHGRLPFTRMPALARLTMECADWQPEPTYADIIEADAASRALAESLVARAAASGTLF